MKTGAELIAMERERQVMQEDWSDDSDDQLVEGELAGAGACYALWHCKYVGKFTWRLAMALWPMDQEDWKPKDAVRDLTRAGALIAAEIDRLQRRKTEGRIITQ